MVFKKSLPKIGFTFNYNRKEICQVINEAYTIGCRFPFTLNKIIGMKTLSKCSITLCFFLAVMLFQAGQIKAQTPDNNLIHWQPTPLLTYADFMGQPENVSEVAMTSSGFYFNYQYNGKGVLTVELYATFDKSQSWFKPDAKVPEVLAHEQCHFDIAELYVRKLRQQISNATFKTNSDVQKELSKMFNDCNSRCAKEQRNYDAQTKHGIDTEKQEQWQEKIAKELAELNDFTQEKMEIKVN